MFLKVVASLAYDCHMVVQCIVCNSTSSSTYCNEELLSALCPFCLAQVRPVALIMVNRLMKFVLTRNKFIRIRTSWFSGEERTNMDDTELAAIRAKRMAELQGQKMEGGSNEKQDGQRQEAAARQEEMKNNILCQVLDQNARARLNTIAAAKPEKAAQLETMIINMARYGQIRGKLGDDEFKQLLDKVSDQMHKTTTVKFDRRRAGLDSDEDDDE